MASFGENLKRQRELRGIELREIAEATKISIRFLQALESDRFEILPGGVFRRSFVREYARCVGLDVDRTVADFLHAHTDDGSPEKKTVDARAPDNGFYRRLLLGGAILAVSATAGAWNYARTAAKVVVAPPPVPSPAVYPEDRLMPTGVPVETAVEAAEPLVLILTAREDCWVRVEAQGRVLVNEVLLSGRSQTVHAGEEVLLSVGNAAALDLRINDRPAQALGGRGEVRKNIVINKENLPSLVEEVSPRRTVHSG